MVAVLDPFALTGFRHGLFSVSAQDNRVYLIADDGAIPLVGGRVLASLDDTSLSPIGSDWGAANNSLVAPGSPLAVGSRVFDGRLAGVYHGEAKSTFINTASGWQRHGYDPRSLFGTGIKGGIWLPEYSDVAVTNGVGTVTDISGNGASLTQGVAGNKPVRTANGTTGFDYLLFDGSNDWLETAAIDFTGTDEVTVFAWVRKLSDAAFAIVAELSATSGSNNGAFLVSAPSAANATYAARSRGSVSVGTATAATFAAPHSAILTMRAKISTDTLELRVNGVSAATNASDQGAGNYGNHILYVGRRAGASDPFNGHLYGLIVLGRLATTTEIANVERMGAARMGVTLP